MKTKHFTDGRCRCWRIRQGRRKEALSSNMRTAGSRHVGCRFSKDGKETSLRPRRGKRSCGDSRKREDGRNTCRPGQRLNWLDEEKRLAPSLSSQVHGNGPRIHHVHNYPCSKFAATLSVAGLPSRPRKRLPWS